MSKAESRVTVHYDDLVAEHPAPVLVIKKQPRAATPDTATKVWKYPNSVLAIAEVIKLATTKVYRPTSLYTFYQFSYLFKHRV